MIIQFFSVIRKIINLPPFLWIEFGLQKARVCLHLLFSSYLSFIALMILVLCLFLFTFSSCVSLILRTFLRTLYSSHLVFLRSYFFHTRFSCKSRTLVGGTNTAYVTSYYSSSLVSAVHYNVNHCLISRLTLPLVLHLLRYVSVEGKTAQTREGNEHFFRLSAGYYH